MLQLNVSQASTICRASGRAMRSLGIWLRQSAFCKLKKNFSFPWTGKENYALLVACLFRGRRSILLE